MFKLWEDFPRLMCKLSMSLYGKKLERNQNKKTTNLSDSNRLYVTLDVI